MAIVALLYHDVIGEAEDDSGFPGPAAASYKLPASAFISHLEAVAAGATLVGTSAEILDTVSEGFRTLLTFDDGGSSALSRIAPLLEGRRWVGHFFITSDFVGSRGFLDRAQIAELHARGHVIGSHSCSHPLRFADCGWDRMLREWRDSTDRLSDILGEQTLVASVPGGQFSRRVAAAAREAGIRILFNSEPTTRVRRIEDCLVVGRFSIKRSTPPRVAGWLAAGRIGPRMTSSVSWNAKKLAKRIGGESYLRLREVLFRIAASR